MFWKFVHYGDLNKVVIIIRLNITVCKTRNLYENVNYSNFSNYFLLECKGKKSVLDRLYMNIFKQLGQPIVKRIRYDHPIFISLQSDNTILCTTNITAQLKNIIFPIFNALKFVYIGLA